MDINAALQNAPSLGIASTIYPRMAVTHDQWKVNLFKWIKTGDRYYDEAYAGTEKSGLIGLICVIEQGGYSYAYIINMHGDYDSIMFTEGYPTCALINDSPYLSSRINLIQRWHDC